MRKKHGKGNLTSSMVRGTKASFSKTLSKGKALMFGPISACIKVRGRRTKCTARGRRSGSTREITLG